MVPDETRGVSSRLRGFAAALAAVGAALLIHVGLARLAHINLPAFITFYPMVLLVALYCGFWPGCLAGTLSGVAADYYIFPPVHTFDLSDPSQAISILLFVSICVFLSGVAEFYRRGQLRITALEQKVMKEELKLSQERFAAVLENLTEGILIGNAEGHLYYWNPAALAQFGYASMDECRRMLPDFADTFEIRPISGEELVPVEEWPMSRVLGGEVLRDWRVRIRRLDQGWEKILSYNGWLIRSTGGEMLAFLATSDITEGWKAEAALRESETRLRLAYGAGRIGAFEWNVETGVNVWTPELEAMYGLAPGEFRRTHLQWEQLLHPEDRARAIRLDDQTFETGEPVEGEWRVIWPDGSTHWIAARFQALKDDEGKPLRLTGVNIDITKQKEAEQALKLTNDRFELALRNSPVIVFNQDLDLRYTWMHNPALAYQAHEVIGKKDTDIFERDSDAFITEGIKRQVIFSGQGHRQEVTIHAGGVDRCYDLQVDPLWDGEENIVGVTCAAVDLTERKLAELAQKENAKLLSLALEAGKSGFFDWDLVSGLSRWSPELERIYGLQPSAYNGELNQWREWLPAEDLQIADKCVEEALQTGRLAGEWRIIRQDDHSIRWIGAHGVVLHDKSSRPVRLVGINVDITDRKLAQEELIRSEKSAAERKQLQALASHLQHAREEERKKVSRDLHDQIGQMLTAIKMDVSWAARRLNQDQGQVHDRLTRAATMVNEGVVSIRSICSGLRPGVLDDLGLAAAVEWQVREFESRTGISSTYSLPASTLHLDSDQSTGIFRIFQECLTNVARHAEATAVTASLYEENGDVLLVVKDNGRGFETTKISGSLGLLGMRERAQVCGGDVQIASSPGFGTTITVRVPLQVERVEA